MAGVGDRWLRVADDALRWHERHPRHRRAAAGPSGGGDTALVLESLDAEHSRGAQSLLTSALGQSAPMQRIMALVPRLANSEATLLIEGETGTGKTLLARLIHKESPRHQTPFVVIDCG